MKIAAAGLRPYNLTLHRPWTTATHSTPNRAGVLLWLRDKQGNLAWGDACPQPGARRGGYAAVERSMTQLVASAPSSTGSTEVPLLPPIDPSVRHAWTQAILTLEALREGVPLAARLKQDLKVRRSAADRVRVNALIPVATETETVAMAAAAVKNGFSCLKMKIQAAPREVRRVAAVRDAVGGNVRLRLDVNGAWSENVAPRLLEALAPHNIEYIEQPLPPARLPSLLALKEHSPIPIAIDESAQNLAHALALIEKAAIDVVIVKPMPLGGLDRGVRLLEAAHRNGVRAVVTDSVESAVGRTAALHLASLLGTQGPHCGVGSGLWIPDDVVPDPPRPRRGSLEVPNVPGLGLGPLPEKGAAA